MASQFTLTGKSYDGRYMTLSCVQTRDPNANTSRVDWTLTVAGGNSNYYTTGPTTVKINGVQVAYYGRKSYSTHEFPTGKGSVSGSVTIRHQDDGTSNIPVSLSTAIYTSAVSTVSGTWNMDANPRESLVTATSGNIGQTVVIGVTRYAKGYTHALQYRFGSLTGWVGTGGQASAAALKHTDTTLTFTLPEAIYGQIPEETSLEGSLTCYTYSGDTLVGTKDCAFTAYADKNLCAPLVSGVVTDCNEKTLALTGNEHVLVRYRSTARCIITAQARKEATLARKRIGTVTVTEDTRDISYIENTDIAFSAKDSRGYETTVVVSPQVVPYVRLTNNASVKRTDPTSGNATVRLRGSCFYGSFGAVENTLVARYHIGGRDTVEIPVEIREDHTYDVTIQLPGFDYDQDVKFYVTMEDALSTAQKTVTVYRGIPVFDWGEKDFAFHVPVSFDSSVSGVYMNSVTINGSNTITLKTRFDAFDGAASNRQAVFLFGHDNNGHLVLGVAGVNRYGTTAWTGSEGVTVTAGEAGKIHIHMPNNAYDRFVLMSPHPFTIIT